MKQTLTISLFLTLALLFGCGGTSSTTSPANEPAANTEPKPPVDGYYTGKGVVTKIDNELGSVELDHEAIEGLNMPAMKMEFNVRDKAILKPIAVGDAVVFTLEHKQGTDTVITLGK